MHVEKYFLLKQKLNTVSLIYRSKNVIIFYLRPVTSCLVGTYETWHNPKEAYENIFKPIFFYL